jgi:hypothetical protein
MLLTSGKTTHQLENGEQNPLHTNKRYRRPYGYVNLGHPEDEITKK